MSRFLVSALGSAGDVHPFIAISRVLIARGHVVRMIAAPHFEARIRKAGVDFAALGAPGDYERLLQRPELWQPRGGARFILRELMARLPEAYEVTSALATAPDTVLVGSTLSWAMRLVQEKRGLPCATVHLSPLCMPSAIAPPVLPGIGDLSWMPTPAMRLLQWAGERFVLDRVVGPDLNGFRATLGLPPVKRIWSTWMHSPQLVVGAWPEWFAPRQVDWPAHGVTTGFPIFDEGGAQIDATLAAFLDAGPAPIGITPGSAMAHGKAFFAKALETCGSLGRRAVLVTPFRDQLPATLPAWAHHVDYVPFSVLMPRLLALIHHGGIGTSAQALAAGLPQIVIPFAHDQFDNAARLKKLGVSVSLGSDDSVAAGTRTIGRFLAAPATDTAIRASARWMTSVEPATSTIPNLLERLGG